MHTINVGAFAIRIVEVDLQELIVVWCVAKRHGVLQKQVQHVDQTTIGCEFCQMVRVCIVKTALLVACPFLRFCL